MLERGKGNFCICGHNSTIYAEIFNDLDQIQIGDEMYLVDNDANRTKYLYIVTEYKTVEPNQVEVLNDYGDNRLTVISCTDDGKQRQVVVGILKE
ncbi:MAG: sortase [Ruminococcus sp.]|nr:sortase [Ruminococcus sp.]